MTASPLALPPGTRLENFLIESRLGRGGFGITYLATEYSLRVTAEEPEPVLRRVAVKEYFPMNLAWRVENSRVIPIEDDDGAKSAFFGGLRAFLKEAQAIASLDHPGIIRIHRVFESHGTAYFSMPYLAGKSLGSLLPDGRLLSWEEIQRWLLPLLDALDEAHRNGVLHRDLKPDNILLAEDQSRTVLIDFGAARMQAATDASRYTRATDLVAYTPGYAPIEQYDQATNANRHGFYTDIYAFCATLYRAVTGQAPPEATARIMHRVDPMISVTEVCHRPAAYPASLLAAIEWGLERLPSNRPQTVGELRAGIRDLERIPPGIRVRVGYAGHASPPPEVQPGDAQRVMVDSESVTIARSPVDRLQPEMPYVARFAGADREWAQIGLLLVPPWQTAAAEKALDAVWQALVCSGFDFCLRVRAAAGKVWGCITVQAQTSASVPLGDCVRGLEAVGAGCLRTCTTTQDFESLLEDFPRLRLHWDASSYSTADVPVVAPLSWSPLLGGLVDTARLLAWTIAYQLNAHRTKPHMEVIRSARKQLLLLQKASVPPALVQAQAAELQRYEDSTFCTDELIGCVDSAVVDHVVRQCQHRFEPELRKLGFRDLPLRRFLPGESDLLDDALGLGFQTGLLAATEIPAQILASARRPQDLPSLASILMQPSKS